MKRYFILIFLLFINITIYSQKIELKSAKSNQKKSLVKNIDKNNIEIYLPLKIIELKDNFSKNGNFINLKNQKLVRSYDIGNPNLPVYSKLIEVPQNSEVKISIISYDEEIINLKKNGFKNKIYPAQEPLSKSIDPEDAPFKINKKTYNTNAFYGNNKLAFYENLGQMRAQHLGRIQINPFKYNPVTNKLKVYNNIVIKITFENADWNKTEIIKQKYSSPFFSTKDANIINSPKSSTKELIQSVPVTYVIVSDSNFKIALQPFVEWKRQKGFHVIEAYTDNIAVGTTVSSIKAYLKNLYDNPATGVNPPSFILLVGDVDKIPATKHSEVEDSPWSDLDYAEYTGDYLPEVLYGRFSADNETEVSDIVYKTIKYEKYQMADPSYLKETLLVAGDDENNEDTYGGGAIWYADNYYLNSTNGIYSHTFLQKTIETWGGNYAGNQSAHDSIIANINSGVALANYTAHCSPDGWYSPSFTQNDLNTDITNTDKFGIWIGNCCQSNKFEENESFGELALRKPNAGVIGYIGGSQFTYWDEDYYWGVGYASVVEEPSYSSSGLGTYDGLFHNKANEINDLSKWYITSDQLIKSGNLAVQASGSNLAPYYWVIYHLMGDPSLMPYLGVPDPLTVSINQQELLIGNSTVSLTSSPYAYIALSQNNLLLATGQADETGLLTLNLSSPLSGDSLNIVGTAQFKQPYINSLIPIATDRPYVLTDSIKTPILLYGANERMSVYLKNYGTSGNDASDIHTYIHSNDTLIHIIDSTANISSIVAGETAFLEDSFSFSLNNYIPDQYILPIVITVKDAANTITNTTKYLTINAPKLKNIHTAIIDTPDTISISSKPKEYATYGTNYTYNIEVSYPFLNSQLNSGEDIILTLKTTNYGHADIVDVYSLLSTNSSNITIDNAKSIYDSLKKDNSILTNYVIHVDKQNSESYYVDFKYVFGDSIYQDTLNFSLPVNLIFEDFETGDLTKFNWHVSGDANWNVTNTNAYEGEFSAVSGQISDNKQTNLYLYLNDVKANQTLSFYYNVSSEPDYDFLEFWVNDSKIAQWSGNSSWQNYSYTFPTSDNYIIKFVYSKDVNTSKNSDCAWIDFLTFPVLPENSSKSTPISISAPIIPHWMNFTDYGNGTASISGTAPSEDIDEPIRIETSDGNLYSYQEYTLKVRVVAIDDTNESVNIFPNPTSDFLNIEIQTTFSYSKLSIMDLKGRTVLQKRINNQDSFIDIRNIEHGVYLLKLDIDNKLSFYKIIIE